MNKPKKEREEKILTEREFRENTMGCFYQDELREHDRAMRKALQQKEAEVRREVLEEVGKVKKEMIPNLEGADGEYVREHNMIVDEILEVIAKAKQ